jgi:hypothetical protein
MTAVLDSTEARRLDDAEFAAALERLRAYVAQLEEAKQQTTQAGDRADAGSLERAGDAMAVYEDRRWTDKLPAPKKTRGRREKTDSRERFYKYAQEYITSPKTGNGLKRTTTAQLLYAEDVYQLLCASGAEIPAGTTARSLRPLVTLKNKQKRPQEIPAIWSRALELAEGRAPTGPQVSKARNDHDKATGFTGQKATKQKGKVKYGERVIKDFKALLPHSTPAEVREVMAELKREWDEWVAEVRS